MLLIGNGTVCTREETLPWLEDGGVLTDGERIREVGPLKALRDRYPEAEFIDAGGGLILPGFLNAHTHIYSGLARGLTIPGNHPTTFLEVLEGTWWNIDRHLEMDEIRACAWATYLDCIRNGVTTIFDHHASFGEIRGSLFAIEEVAKQAGVRSCLCYEVSERDGMEKCRDAIEENADFARHCKEQGGEMIKAMFGGHALFTLSDETFRAMVRANDGMTGFHIHVAEGMNDVWDSIRNYGCRPVNRLLYNEILGEKTILGHCIHISPAEMDLIRETNTMVVNNPGSNMSNAVGCAPVRTLWEKGIMLGLGTDAYTHDMLESAKASLAVQRHQNGLPDVGWEETAGMLFQNNPRIGERCFQVPLGILKAGAAADIIVMDYRPFTPVSEKNIDGHLLFGMQGSCCRTTIIQGKVRYQDRKFVDLDEEAIQAFCQEQSQKLWGALTETAK